VRDEADVLAFGVFASDRRFKLRRAKFPFVAAQIAALAARLGRTPRVLDAGLGQAKLQRLFAVAHPDVAVAWHGLDLLRWRLELRRAVPGIRRVQGDVTRLPYADAALDAAVCSYVLQHLERPGAALAELARVVRPGGVVLVAVPNAPQPLKLLNEAVQPAWTAWRRRRGRRFSYTPQVQFYNLPRLRRLVRAAGLEDVGWQGLGFVSGGPLRPLENAEWFYRANLWLGARAPRFGQDLVCVARRPR